MSESIISNVGNLEPFGLLTLALSVIYSIGVLTVNPDHFKFHFVVMTFFVFTAFASILCFKYIKYKYTCEKMDDIIASMKIR